MLYIVCIALILILANQTIDSLKYLHMLQLEGYNNWQYTKWLRKNYYLNNKNDLIFIGAVIISFFVLGRLINPILVFEILLGIISVYLILKYVLTSKTPRKKKLVYTHRLIRLLITNTAITILEGLSVFYICLSNEGQSLLQQFFIILIMIIVVPINVYIANIINYPIEKMVHKRYKLLAKRKIQKMSNLKVIGLTGSYGKTSTKHFLYTILKEKYNCLMTPESYNTPMGICKVIRENLNDSHEVFIVEMGARRPGEIKEICQIVNPMGGIITSIGAQHLETFKSVEKVADTKFELIYALPTDGIAVLNGDNEYCVNNIHKVKTSVITYGIDNKDVDIHAENIHYSSMGTTFDIHDKTGIVMQCSTIVLGKHNIYNILAAVCMAHEIGLDYDAIGKGIGKIEAVEHRLQIVPTVNGLIVIDDTFNSNPIGSKAALEVISTFGDGNKIIITPGMIELGKKESHYNKEFGKNIANVCQYAILVGAKRTKAITDGLEEVNFPKNRIIIVNNLDEATQKLGGIAKPGDVVLFENDLPDNYNE